MKQTQIERIKFLKVELNALVVELTPESGNEWEGFDHLYAASRDMRRINIDKLGQLPLPDYEALEAARHLQPDLPLEAAVQPGEGSLNEGPGTTPALNTTSDQEFDTIPSASKRRKGVRHDG